MIAWEAHTQVVVVGSGVAGLTCAIEAGRAGLSVLVLTKGAADEANTHWAQGGVAVVRDERDPGDTVGAHIEDTLVAGVGLSDPAAVTMILTEGPAAIARLVARGAHFDTGPMGLMRTREGGHSANRVIHAGGDATGAEIERCLLAADGLPGMLTGHQVLDVVRDVSGRAAGVTVLGDDGTIGLIRADAVVLATGGAGHLYAATTNPDVATGDGLAMALRAGAALADLEFMQFHPTVLFTGAGVTGHRPLVTEAVRGEGAVLIDVTGARVMAGVHPLGDLAPRDVVSLAITRRLATAPGGVRDHVFLDATGIAPDVFARRFPTVSASCAAAGIDPATDPIPVAPAAHYHCGGVVTDPYGRTTVPGLYAVGEVARTGLHGANRLASNSLLEGLVMGERAAAALPADLQNASPTGALTVPARPGLDPAGRGVAQAAMSAEAGIGRDRSGLERALGAISAQPSDDPTRAGVEAANLALVSTALVRAALVRTESRGCHVRTDHPATSAEWTTSVLVEQRDGVLHTDVRDLRKVTV
ncbi:L-aspartate oxidase [Nakamurella panacisegetis]|uniref:L-aspartate oxidase n=1 Tax=Nakamurella panacisegetis TaxID=1090615 RepID=A0A1H0R4A3_9ACTN|nr:L-aspartate oxidase [Nakamurella panacisegetis]SDP24353.1 L-aspartate oxidase [Nakamurella panacisegetis]